MTERGNSNGGVNGSHVYRWSMADEENLRKNRRNKYAVKTKKSAGLRIFAVIMSVMFLFTAAASVYFLGDYITGGRFSSGGNNDSAGNPGFVISNKDALEETKNDSSPETANDGDIIKDTSAVAPLDNSAAGPGTLTGEEARIRAIAKVNPSVVCIEVETEVSGYMSPFGRRTSPYIQQGIGTGFIVSPDGYIATNYHVVSNSDKITVTLFSGEKYVAELIGGNEPEDLAILKINAANLTAAELGDSDALVQGQDVVAIGTPAGIEFAWTATKGMVSSVSRVVDVNGQRTMTVIQTDASINPGNSGGPLINMRGQVIGINSMKLASTQYEGMGFAIPINIAIPAFNEIIANPGEIIESPYGGAEDLSEVSFGLSGRTVDPDRAEYYNIPTGWQISGISEDGPSYSSGLQLSDIIIALDGETVSSTEDMYELKLKYRPGDTVTVTIYRNGDVYDFEVTLAPMR